VTLSLVLATTAQAQFALGLRAGYNSSKVSVTVDGTSDDEGFSSRGGFHAGADLAIGLSPMFGIEVGAAYSQKGASLSEGGIEGTIAVDYVDVPLLFVVSVPTSGNVTPRLFAGGVASFEMSCKVKASADGVSASVDCSEFEDFGTLKSSYFSALFGAGIGFAAGPGTLLLDVGYQLGLTNISDVTDETAKVNVIQASLGYQFPLGN
jgi:hypothetical protein